MSGNPWRKHRGPKMGWKVGLSLLAALITLQGIIVLIGQG